ncbi:MAG: hypothetical protein V4573_17965 [Pseudomonadota bacterium]
MPTKFVSRVAFTGAVIYSGATALLHRTRLWDALKAAIGLTDVDRVVVTATGALTVDQCGTLLVDASGGNILLTLPASGVDADEALYEVDRLDATANTVTFVPAGADTIGGAASVLVTGTMRLRLPAGKTDWRVHSISGGTPTAARTAHGLDVIIGTAGAQSLRNLLMNGNFNINQRAYVSATATTVANQYTLDRWRVVTSGQNLTFAASGNGNIVTAPAGGIEQVIEGANIGGTTHVINWTGTATCTVDGVAKAKGDTVALTPGTNCTVKFIGGTVGQAQLERGAKATPFEFRPVSVDLALCQRYYETVELGFLLTTGSVTAVAGTGNFIVPKRAVPTLVRLGAGLGGFGPPDIITATATGYYFQRASTNCGGLYSASAEL